ncbi:MULTISPECIES: bifunctional UDP-N-acetylglucosamine diphosphorylase/glucosamine-1-phosphate N-acetyltransferase GlmU [Rhodococcus]|uniref:bifunctional UDP-N-acetylglucosamine diphosphorylase/glucosamine-1-phosphate N-acetyltransferase GlmU n=1 Tax=Rhodococcus TaxID=1827 RepID=UPI00051A803A|nr:MULTISPECIES: bifunctional UDP-N-acetylglucosamine diphosphorylase/glucosamine-1-phosphate N-acetyltransferase GlmU [Rhodococcus]AOD22139.1 UDP-N-acetylglucosamine diphosphorylase/glucosamine-1-phosphate N-acetyltransferase [Rhodococcus sp. p52]KHJ73514.1 bifunctional N-acetylglucosamine-1-phosphate uridyltransferase/glucosamine-1-phosphate acetyltransferase [Rhodococcus sp. Chr-9]UPK63267.1 bifunctional UDP-N-acetylglucosamine diphosphorylase/glucosamine-1-phosphate N-acetyltransferase GlmU 
MQVQTAIVVLAAGAGTRMRSKTPKVLHTLGGRTMLAHSLYAAAALGPDHLVTVVGHRREEVSAEVSAVAADLDREIRVTVQEEQLGTGHAVECGLGALPDDFDGTVVVTAGDVPLLRSDTLQELLDAHLDTEPAAVTVLTTTVSEPTGYGRIVRTTDGDVAGIVEEKDASPTQRAIQEINTGVYAFDAAALRSALGKLSADNSQGELYLTDVVKIARNEGHTVRGLHTDDAVQVSGVNDRVQLAALTTELNRRLLEHWMREGVTVIDPASTWIDVDVVLGADVTIHPGVQLRGRTVIADDAEVGPDTTLTDVQVGAGATVVRTHGSDAVIGAEATVGPFTYLRPGTELGACGKLGAFVETKNAQIGAHSKVPHLTYVGDAEIGEHSNIGASSVFVNYDGVKKYRTVVGSHVRTGSDTMFVAPLTVGDGAYTGAGTVLRRDVPPGALAVSGTPQRNIDGWVQRNRAGTPAAEAASRAQQPHDHDRQKDGQNQ